MNREQIIAFRDHGQCEGNRDDFIRALCNAALLGASGFEAGKRAAKDEATMARHGMGCYIAMPPQWRDGYACASMDIAQRIDALQPGVEAEQNAAVADLAMMMRRMAYKMRHHGDASLKPLADSAEKLMRKYGVEGSPFRGIQLHEGEGNGVMPELQTKPAEAAPVEGLADEIEQYLYQRPEIAANKPIIHSLLTRAAAALRTRAEPVAQEKTCAWLAPIGDPLTARKAKDIIAREGYYVTGVVMTNSDSSKCIVDLSAVRWFPKLMDFFTMMHPDDAPPLPSAQVVVPREQLRKWHRVTAQVAGHDSWGREIQDEMWSMLAAAEAK